MAATDILVKVGADITDFSRKMAESQRALSTFSQKNKATFDAFKVTGAVVTAAGVGIAAGLGGAVKSAVTFESAFAGVRKTVDASEDQFAELEKGIRDMSKELPASAAEIAGVAEVAGQLGIKQKDILQFTRVMVDLGESTNMSSEVAASSLAKLANITQMPMENIDKLGSTIVDLGNNLATTESDITAMAMRIAGAGSQVGLTEAQILSFSGALSSVGIEAEAGGSAFSRVMIEMANASANGGESLENFANVAGMSSAEFKKSFEKDASGAIITFLEGLGKMSDEGENVFGVLDELGLSEIRVRDALLRASGAGDLFRESLEVGNKAWKENTALTNEAEERYKTTAAQFAILKNTVVDFAMSIGQALLPAVQAVTTFLKNLTEKFNGMDDGAKRFIAFATAITGALALITGPILMLIGFIPQIIVGFQSFATVASGLGTALGALSGPIGWIILAIVGIGVALVTAYNKVEWFRDMVDAAWAWIKDAFFTAISWIKDNVVIPIMTEVASFINEILEKVKGYWDKYGDLILSTAQLYFDSIWQYIKAVMGVIKGIFEMVWPIISGIVKIAWNVMKTVIRNTIDIIAGIIDTIMLLIQGDWEGAWNRIKQIGEDIWKNIQRFFEDIDLYEIGRNILDGLIKGFNSMKDSVIDSAKNIGQNIKDAFTGFFSIHSPSRLMASLSKHIPGGAIVGMESMLGKVRRTTDKLSEAMTPETRDISMDYVTPSGSFASLAGAVSGTVDVNAREDMIASAIGRLEAKLENLRIEMDGREFGRAVSDVSEKSRDNAVRSGGRRRI